ncbi:MAG: hypothetical protein K0B02_04880 [DPANN group archaeon]|nr:hypothetical protein [DPANN group archaeon]
MNYNFWMFLKSFNVSKKGFMDYPMIKIGLIVVALLLMTPVIGEIMTESADTLQAAVEMSAGNIYAVMMLLSTVDKGVLCVDTRADAKIIITHDSVRVEVMYGGHNIWAQKKVHLLEDTIFMDTPRMFNWEEGSKSKREICFSKNETHFWVTDDANAAYKVSKIDTPPLSLTPTENINSSIANNIPGCVAVIFGKNMKFVNDTVFLNITDLATGIYTEVYFDDIVGQATSGANKNGCYAEILHYAEGPINVLKYVYDFQDNTFYKIYVSADSKFDGSIHTFDFENSFSIKSE